MTVSDELAIKSRLWERLLANPDDLTDLRIIFVEYVNTKANLDAASNRTHWIPSPSLPFVTFEERQAYLKVVKDAQQWRARAAALKETHDSLCEQLKMMAEGLNPEDLEDFMHEFKIGV